MDGGAWQTSVGELLLIFREALEVLLPVLRKAKIPIGVHPGTDAWDEISETLFSQIVGEAIRWSLATDQADAFELPRYEMDYTNYRRFGGLILANNVKLTHPRGMSYIFHSFRSPGKVNLNHVGVIPVCADLVVAGAMQHWPVEDCTFHCLLLSSGTQVGTVDSLEVQL